MRLTRCSGLLVLSSLPLVCSCQPAGSRAGLSGVVRDEHGPVAGATVRWQATRVSTTSERDGSFRLAAPPLMAATAPPVRAPRRASSARDGVGSTVALGSGARGSAGVRIVTAWAPGYYVGAASVESGARDVTIVVKRYPTTDNPSYPWFAAEGERGSRSCNHCMPSVFDEWQADAHSQSAQSPRFLSVYNGTDLSGRRSPPRRLAHVRDYGQVLTPPDPRLPDYGPGYRLDAPRGPGDCGACHVPGAAARPGMAYAVDPARVQGIDTEGVFCELCHKIGEVVLDPKTGLPFPNRPGVLSMRFYRPQAGEEIFFGPFDDVARRVSYLPLQRQSAFCAPCHFGVFWGVVIYNSFGEWLASPYSNPYTGKSCQDCHMPETAATRFALAERGGVERRAGSIRSHRMRGVGDLELMQSAVRLDASAEIRAGQVEVTATVTNHRTGHHLPTDSPLRHMILVVEARDQSGGPLRLVSGPTLPSWCGTGEPSRGYYAGLPGRTYAKVLRDSWTSASPAVSYWNPTRVLEDTRIPALGHDTSRYTFALAASSRGAEIRVRLLFRRAFIELMDKKQWAVPDLLMAERSLRVGSEGPPQRR